MPRFIAIDWDQNQLHVVSGVAGGGRVKFQRTLVWREEKSPNPAEAEALGQHLRERLKEAGVGAAPVLACVGRDRVILKDLRFPAVPAAEEAGVVRFQAVKELTDSPDDVVIDYVSRGGPPGGEQQAMALIVRRDVLTTYQHLCHAAGLKLAGLTPRVFGIAASFKKATAAAPPEDPEAAAAVVVVGERWAEFSVVKGDLPLMTRSLAVGPGLAGEVRRNLTVYAGQPGRSPVKAVYLAGGDAALRERLAEMLDVPLNDFDPLGGVVGLDAPAGGRGSFAGAAGLLFARAESRGLPINFVQPRQPKPQRDPKNRRVALVAAALLLAAAGIVACCWLVIRNKQFNQQVVQNQRTAIDAQLTKSKADSKLYHALDDWDNVAWPDELYDLTDRIPDVNALRVKQLTAEPTTRNAKSKYTARITIKGNFYGDQGLAALNKLTDGFKQDGYYSPEAPKTVGNEFTLTVNVERRPPNDYRRTLKSADKKGEPGGDEDFIP